MKTQTTPPWMVTVGLLALQAGLGVFLMPDIRYQEMQPLAVLLGTLVLMPAFLIVMLYPDKAGRVLGGWNGIVMNWMGLAQFLYFGRFTKFVLFFLPLHALMTYLIYNLNTRLGQLLYQRSRTLFACSMPLVLTGSVFLLGVAGHYLWMVPATLDLPGVNLIAINSIGQVLSVTGFYGLFFISVAFSCLVAIGLLLLAQPAAPWLQQESAWLPEPFSAKEKQQIGLVAGAMAGVIFILVLLGQADARSAAKAEAKNQRFLQAGLIQPQFSASSHPRTVDTEGQMLNLYWPMCKRAAGLKAEAIFFPENSLPLILPGDRKSFNRISEIFQDSNTFGVIGATTMLDPRRAISGWYLINPQGKIQDLYAKQFPSPVGEYIPERWLVDWVVKGINYLLGKTYQIFKLTAVMNDRADIIRLPMDNLLTTPNAKIIPSICYEKVFWRLFQKGVRDGGEMIFYADTMNWFYTRRYYNSQLRGMAVRAMETRRYVVFVMNSGRAAVINAQGRIVKQSAFGKAAVLVAKIPLLQYRSLYMRWGDWFGWSCVVLSLGLMGWIGFWRRKPEAVPPAA